MSPSPRVLIASHPFGESAPEALELLRATGAELIFNPHRRKLTRDELLDLLDGGVRAAVASTEPYDANLFAARPALRLVARTGVGLDSVDLEAARAAGVIVSCTADAPADSVAELTVGLAVALARHVVRADRALRAGRWERRTGWLLAERCVGIVGLGRIGSRVARLLRPFGCRRVAHDIDSGVAPRARALGVELLSLAELRREADIVTLHVPLTERTRGLVDADFLAALRPGALLLNTARGPVVDEDALLAALRSGHLGGAALDVFEQEPYRGPLVAEERVILTAHMGSCSDRGRRAMELGAARAVAAFLSGEAVPGRVV